MEVGSSDEETPLEAAPFKEEHVHAILRALKACHEILEHKKTKFLHVFLFYFWVYVVLGGPTES